MIRGRIAAFVGFWILVVGGLLFFRGETRQDGGRPKPSDVVGSTGGVASDSSRSAVSATKPAPEEALKTYPATRDIAMEAEVGVGAPPAGAGDRAGYLALVDLARVTHRALKNGDWSDPSVWGGEIPDEGARAHIPEGVAVSLTDSDTEHLKSLRVDGSLSLAPTEDVELKVDTLLVNANGRLTAGTAQSPIGGDVEALISIQAYANPNDSPEARRDSALMVSLGEVSLHGQEKTSMALLSTAPQIGDRELVLEATPLNWKQGDVIVLGGARQSREELQSLQVQYVHGNRVGLSPVGSADAGWGGLADDYTPNRDTRAFAVNVSRNVGVSSPPVTQEIAGQYPNGSVVFSGSGVAGATLSNVGSFGLGADDAVLEGLDEAVNRPAISFENGFGDGVAQVTGLALVDAPESGVKLNGAAVNLTDSVAYDLDGGGWLTSSGSASRLVWNAQRSPAAAVLGGQAVAP